MKYVRALARANRFRFFHIGFLCQQRSFCESDRAGLFRSSKWKIFRETGTSWKIDKIDIVYRAKVSFRNEPISRRSK